ncbi:MAG TPA: hypothetical protein VF103_11595 [Polyangiaceae bacterium]
MRRSHGVFLACAACAGCGERASLVERGPAATPAPVRDRVSELPLLPTVARTGRPPERARILEPLEGAELDADAARELSVRVEGARGDPSVVAPGGEPAKMSLLLSLDGARPRPVELGTLGIRTLLDPGGELAAGAHDLVLCAVGPDGSVLDPEAGGVASVRFFVGRRPAATAPPRIVCLSPFGTYYGNAPKIALDFVVASGDPLDVVVAIDGAGGARRARAAGRGPFALGDFESGDYRVSLEPGEGSPPVLPGRCVFAYNREIERSP